jgi:hypothetical protein
MPSPVDENEISHECGSCSIQERPVRIVNLALARLVLSRRLERPCRRWRILALPAIVVLTACSPSLNWREARLNAPDLLALFPCRPVAQSRNVPLGAAEVTLTLHACEAGGQTFAVATADMRDPGAVDAGLKALRDATLAKAGDAAASAPPAVVAIEGMTPQPAAGRWHLQGRGPDGPVPVDMAVFAHGTWVVQATVIGGGRDAQATAPFFEGLRFAR